MREPDECARCRSLRLLVERLVEAGIDWLDDADADLSELEDDEREVVSEDDGVVDPVTLSRGLRG